MKIAILSDLHLGYRQYGSMEREEDFYNQYIECMTQIKDSNPDMVIIAGDIFDKPNPSPKAMDVYRQGILLLDGCPVCTITGNHTMLMRENHYTVDNYFSESGIDNYYLIDDVIKFEDDLDIIGLIYRSDTDLEDFNDVHKSLKIYQKEDNIHILVIHQAVKEFCGFTGAELSINDIDTEGYDLIICGHIHSPLFTEINDGKTMFLQPGSIERMNTTEAADEQSKGKGFFIYDTDQESVFYNPVDSPREFFIGDIEFNTLEDIETHFDWLNKEVSKKTIPPIVSYNYYDLSGNLVHIRELMKNVEGVLINNSNLYDLSEENPSVEISENEIPTVLEALDMINSDVVKGDSLQLCKDIFSAYDNDEDDKVEGILDNFFKKRYERNQEESIPNELIEKMEREIREYEEFVDNLGRKYV